MEQLGRHWILDRLREVTVRLAKVRNPARSIPVVQTAGISRSAISALEEGMRRSANRLMQEASRQMAVAANVPKGDAFRLRTANKHLALLQIRADSLFTTFDLLQDATAIRSDALLGRMLRGVDVLLEHALRRPVPGYRPPLAISYLDSSGRGGAIARARTRLPGGFTLPVALVRVSPESLPLRLSSALHEAGHQLSADLNLLDEAARKLRDTVIRVTGERQLAQLYSTWASELMADLWGIVIGGGAPAVDGLQRVLSLPEQLLYQIRRNAPHPPGPVRVAFADAASRLLHEDPALDTLRRRFEEIYGAPRLAATENRRFEALLQATPAAARALLKGPFAGLGGMSVAECGEPSYTNPVRARNILAVSSSTGFRNLGSLPPLQGLAVLAYARLDHVLPVGRLHAVATRWLCSLADRTFGTRGRPAPPRSAG